MSIKSIEIVNFKSIEYLKLDINNLNTFIGKNGAGKSTIMKAIKYFYDNLLSDNVDNKVFDKHNFFKKKMDITIEYDFKRIYKHSSSSFKSKINSILRTNPQNLNSFNKLENFSIKLTLTQVKNSELYWNFNYDTRYVFKNTHPIYFLYPREMDLTNWNEVWDMLGDLINANFAKNISKDMSSILPENDEITFLEHIKDLKSFFSQNNLNLANITNQQKIISLLQLQLGGSKFVGTENELDYFSDGTNSKNYILFVSYISHQISLKRLKDATVILDEPELGLHPKMIDELMENIALFSKRVNFIIFSHSPRLTAHVLKNVGDVYKLSNQKNYTLSNKLVKNNSTRTRLQVTEREASFLFSDFLLFVEGITEYELFTHPFITNLFPFLKNVEIVNTNSNDIILDLLNSENNKSEIPFLILIDLDKIVDFKFVKSESVYVMKYKKVPYSFIKNNEKKEKLFHSYNIYRKEIMMLAEIEEKDGSSFRQLDDFDFIDNSFLPIYEKILYFSKKFSLYPIRIDVESILTSNDFFQEWYQQYTNKSTLDINNFNLLKNREKYMLNSFLISGKDEFLKKVKPETLHKSFRDFKPLLKDFKVNKNSEWLTKYFNFYADEISKLDLKTKDIENKFSKDFSVLYDIIITIKKMMR